MFKQRSNERELLDDFSLSGPDLEKNLNNFNKVNCFLGGNSSIRNALIKIIKETPTAIEAPLCIADLGCGGGDILRMLAKGANKKAISCQFVGIDANQASIDFSTKKSHEFPNIRFEQQNLFSEQFKKRSYDIIMLSTVCHHFNDNDLRQLLIQLKKQAKLAIIISDLHRHWFPYHAIKILTRIFPCSKLEKNDAPLSVLKAFKRKELERLLSSIPNTHYKIKWCWAFRYQIILH